MDNDVIKPSNQTPTPPPAESPAPAPQPQTPPPSVVKTSKKSKLKPLLWVLITLLLMAGAAYGAYKWENNRASNVEAGLHTQINTLNTKNAALQTELAKLQKALKSQTSTATSTTVVKITQLGVQISVPDSIKDLVFANASSTSVGISTSSLVASDKACTASAKSMGTFVKGTGTFPKTPTAQSGALAKQLSGYYIGWIQPQSSCSTNQQTTALLTSQLTALHSAFDTIAPIQ